MQKDKILPLYLATGNQHKLLEIQQMIGNRAISLHSCSELGSISWDETGQSFAENALIKAQALAGLTDQAILADDSGLVVPALGGEPGIYSSRYAGASATDQQNMEKLIEHLQKLPEEDRAGYFICVLCFRDWQGDYHYFEGRCPGRLVLEPRGSHGFGYDPIFQPDGMSQTMAELDQDEKNTISHRRKAFDHWFTRLQVGMP
ncbi:MAG: RdgB/HAM1 family non-canonical purine NTP pyrophosphatase [Oligoflexus sp.]